jgi:tripartite-type tricarboxylate transporter receptor subunit TctC
MTTPLVSHLDANAQGNPQAGTPGGPQGWPAGTIKLVVPYPPGGSTDVIARLVQPCLQQRLATTVIIENRAGASGSVGTAAVAKSPADGGTWLIVFDNHAANPFVLPDLPYDTEKDLDPVLFIGTAPYVVSTQAQKPFKTLADVIAAAKAKPGAVSYASVGSGSVGHLAMALLSKQAGVRLVHVPYRGGGPAMNDAVAGHVDLLVGSTALSIPQIKAGTIRGVVQTGKARTATLGALPTVGESGFPGFEAYAWWGVFAPAGTPLSAASAPSSRPACARNASPASSPTPSRSRSCWADQRSCASSSASRCGYGARSPASRTSRPIERGCSRLGVNRAGADRPRTPSDRIARAPPSTPGARARLPPQR